jgi:hypothetical protein
MNNVIYRLVYYVRNDYMIITDIYDNKIEYTKSRKTKIVDFLTDSFKSNGIIK